MCPKQHRYRFLQTQRCPPKQVSSISISQLENQKSYFQAQKYPKIIHPCKLSQDRNRADKQADDLCHLEILTYCNCQTKMLIEVSRFLTTPIKGQHFHLSPYSATCTLCSSRLFKMTSFISDGLFLVNKTSNFTTWSNSHLRSCSPGADNVFGPQVTTDCRSFDFTLLFEESFFSICPSVVLLVVAPVRIFLLHGATAKVAGGAYQKFKLVS